MSTVAEKKLSKRIKILDAAYGLFSDNSVNATAIDEVVKLAGVAKGTFYLYFKDKYDLLDQIIIYKSLGVLAEVAKALESERKAREMSLAEQITFIIDSLIGQVSANRKLAAFISHDIPACIRTLEMSDNPTLVCEKQRLLGECERCGMTAAQARTAIYAVTDMSLSVYFDTVCSKLPCRLEDVMQIVHNLINKTFSGGERID